MPKGLKGWYRMIRPCQFEISHHRNRRLTSEHRRLSHLQHDPVQWKQHCTPYGRCYNVCDITVKVTPDSSCELSVTVIVLDTLDSYPNNFLDAVRVLCLRQISVSLAHSETFTIVVCLKQCMTSGPVEAGHGVAQTLPHYYFVNALGKVFWCVRDADLTNLKPHPRHSAGKSYPRNFADAY